MARKYFELGVFAMGRSGYRKRQYYFVPPSRIHTREQFTQGVIPREAFQFGGSSRMNRIQFGQFSKNVPNF